MIINNSHILRQIATKLLSSYFMFLSSAFYFCCVGSPHRNKLIYLGKKLSRQNIMNTSVNFRSQEGKGVWVVKSRNAASPTAIPQPSTTLPPANTEPQQHPKQLRKQPSIICCPTSS